MRILHNEVLSVILGLSSALNGVVLFLDTLVFVFGIRKT